MILAPTLTLSAGSGAAIVRPTFSRDFAGEKTLNNGTGPAITFTRASNATFFDANGVLRLAPHNLLLHSEDFENAAWAKELGATVTANTSAAPDGSVTADTITFTTTNSNRVQQTAGTAVNGETLTFSVWLKGTGTVSILLDTSTSVGGSSEQVATLSSTWTRYTRTVTYSSPTGSRRAAVIWRTGNTATSVDVWGAQLVTGSQAGEYFRTTNAAASMPRFDHDPATGASRGLLIEESRTNSIRNSQAGGSTNGVIGSGGVMPTNGWSITANANGVTSEIIGTGTESGFAYIDIKVSGTPSAAGSVFINFEPAAQITAATGQTWTQSGYFKLASGTVTNAACSVNIRGLDAAGVQVGTSTTQAFTPTSSAIATQRASVTRALADAGIERVQGRALVSYTSGNPIDLTLRIAAPQLEQGAFPTSYIPTTTAAATRSADSAVVTPISSFYNQSEGTLFAEGLATNTEQAGLVFDNGTVDNRITAFIRKVSTSALPALIVASGSVQTAFGNFSYGAAASKVAVAYKADDSAATANGATVGTDSSATIPTVTTARIGSNHQPAFLNGHIRKIAYYPRRLSNALLQQLTT